MHERPSRARLCLCLLPLLAICRQSPQILRAGSSRTRERTAVHLTDGVFTIRHPDDYPGYINGNTTVSVGECQILVVDSCRMSSQARQDIAQIGTWTDKPVRFLLNTHWHHDHYVGNKDYIDASRGLTILAHAETRRMMDATHDQFGPARDPRHGKVPAAATFERAQQGGRCRHATQRPAGTSAASPP